MDTYIRKPWLMHLLIDFSVKNAVLLAIDTALPEMADIKHEFYFFRSVSLNSSTRFDMPTNTCMSGL